MREGAAFELRDSAVPFVDADHLVDSDGRDFVAAGIEGDAVQSFRGFGKSQNALPRFDAPQFDRLIGRGGDERLAVGAEGHSEDRTRVVLQGVNFLSRHGIPQDQQLVVTGGDELVVCGAEGQRIDRVGVAGENARFITADLPDPDVSYHARHSLGGGDRMAVGAEGDRVDRILGPGQSLGNLAGGGVNQQHVAVPGRRQPMAVGAERDGRDCRSNRDRRFDVPYNEFGG